MKILTRYTIKELLGPLFFGIFAFTSMMLGFLMIALLKEAQVHHLPILSTVKLLLWRTPEYLMDSAPLSVLLATLLGMGNLTSHSETIAMRAGGVSYFRLALPIVLVGVFVSLAGIAMNQFIVPQSLCVFDEIKNDFFSEKSSAEMTDFKKDFVEGNLVKHVYAEIYKPKEQAFYKTIILEVYKGKISRTIEADIMYWDGKTWYFRNGRIFQYAGNNFYPIIVSQGQMYYPLNLTPTEVERGNKAPDRQSITELYDTIQDETSEKEKRSLLVDFHLKMAMPFASLIFALMGTPLALRPQRRSNAAGFGLCIIFILIWYALMAVGTYMGRDGVLPPFIGAWLPNIVLAGYGIHVFRKVKS